MASELNCKCVMIGDHYVGKTALISSYITRKYQENVPEVLHSNGYTKQFEINDKLINLSIWDGNKPRDGYDRLRPLYYPLTDVFILCFSFNDQWSFKNIKKTLEPEIHHHCPGIPFLIVGCKRDLITSQVCSTAEEMDKLIFGYLRKYRSHSALQDVTGIIEKYIQNGYDDRWAETVFVSDELFEEVCHCFLSQTQPKQVEHKCGCYIL